MYRALLVEKDKAFMEMAVTFLTRINRDIRVVPCEDPEDAMTLIEKFNPDIIISDHSPPTGVDGLSLFRTLLRRNKNYPFITMVGNGSEEVAVEALNMGIDFYMIKDRPPRELFTDLADKIVLAVEKRRIEDERGLNERRLKALVRLAKMHRYGFSEVAHFVLEESVKLTRSAMGYFALYDEKRDLLTMYSWSQAGMKECRIEEKPIEYPMDKVGIWGEPIRQKRAIMVNDYSTPNPLTKGIPKGHVGLKRLMMIPLMHDGKVIGTAGVANKLEPYDNTDLNQMNLLMDGMTSIYMGRLSGEARYETERRYEEMLQFAPVGIMVVDNQGIIVECNLKARKILDNLYDESHVGRGLIEYKNDFTIQLYSAVMDAIRNRSATHIKLRFRSQNLNITLQVSIQPRMNGKEEIKGAIITLEDMSTIESSLEKLERASFQLNVVERMTFLEVSNQIQIIKGYVNFIKAMTEDEPLRENLDRIIDSSDRIQERMRFAKDFRNVGIMSPEWQNIGDIMSQLILTLGFDEEMIEINTGNLEVLADPQLSKALENLMESTLADDTVTIIKIGFNIVDGRMQLVYEDDGKGIPDNHKGDIFDVSSPLGANGMYLVKEVLDVTNFNIIENGRHGDGTRYEISVPNTHYRLKA